jgi:hypothetical protein
VAHRVKGGQDAILAIIADLQATDQRTFGIPVKGFWR